jgi:hypothetical protein
MAKKIKRMADGGSTDSASSGSKLNPVDILLGGLTRPIWETLSNSNSGVPGLIKRLGQKDEDEKKASTPGAAVRPTMRKGGSVKSSASKRGDGCAQRGKTRGKMR